MRPIPTAWLVLAALIASVIATGWGWTIGGGVELARADPAFAMPGRVLAALAVAVIVRAAPSLGRILAAATLLGSGLAFDGVLPLLLAGWIDIAQPVANLVAGGVTLTAASLVLRTDWRSRWRFGAVTMLGIGLAFTAASLVERAYDSRADQPTPIALLTGLPIIWDGDPTIADIVRGTARPHPVISHLSRRYDLVVIDSVAAAAIEPGRVLVIAHPRALAPEELVAIDAFVRGGGRAVVLADALLGWHAAYPLGDRRNPPVTSLLTPLIAHWGLELMPADDSGLETVRDGRMRVALVGAGRFERRGGACELALDAQVAICRIGRGQGVLVGDADWLDPALWAGGWAEAGVVGARWWSNANPAWLAALIARTGAARPTDYALFSPQWISGRASGSASHDH